MCLGGKKNILGYISAIKAAIPDQRYTGAIQ